MENRFEERYRADDTPWDHGTPDTNLIDMVTQRPIPKCKVLDVGCGTGDNAIWLAQQHFVATGSDFLTDGIPDAPFGLVVDRGCLHSVDTAEERSRFAENVASHLEEDGLWLSLVGNADGQVREIGPPTLTASELITAVEPYYEIISLTAGCFGSNQPDPPKAWVCLMRKRKGISTGCQSRCA